MSSTIGRFLRGLKALFVEGQGPIPQDVNTDQSISSGARSLNVQAGDGSTVTVNYQLNSAELVDQRIDEELEKLRKSRFFKEFDAIAETLLLADKLTNGALSDGSTATRRKALAWCARLLARSEHLDRGEECLQSAMTLGSCDEIIIANAFIASHKEGNKNVGLAKLTVLESAAALSARLNIVAYHDGEAAAVDWLSATGSGVEELDSDGRFFLLAQYLSLDDWDSARKVVDTLDGHDYERSPCLHHLAAIVILAAAIPVELRKIVLTQVPFNARDFPLRADAEAMNDRKRARSQFDAAVIAAKVLKLINTANEDQEYALWLELTDPDESARGKERLEELLGDPYLKLRLVPLALQFGVNLDIGKVEREIDAQMAKSGGITRDGAVARFSLIDSQNSPADVASYVERHFDDLAKHLVPKALRCIQIEAYAKSGSIDKANEMLGDLLAEGITNAEETQLRTIISESEGEDPVASLRQQFEVSDSLSDLDVLVRALEAKKDWQGVCLFGEKLFQRAPSIQNAERYINALSNSHHSARVVELMSDNSHLLSQSKLLKLSYAWSLYHEGALLAAKEALSSCDVDFDERNYRSLKVNLAIALGDWASLLVFIDNEYAEQANREA